jgi:RNA polymerase sigma-70 factor (ECF subfamily)
MTAQELASLVDAHAGALVLYARQWCATPEDVVQAAFLKLVGQRRPPDDPLPWLFRVVRNAALDAVKTERRRQKREACVARPARWFVEPAVEGLDSEAAVAALQRLPAEDREAIVARLWGGLSFEEIGALAGTSGSTAFRRFQSGIASLRRGLGVPCPTDPS